MNRRLVATALVACTLGLAPAAVADDRVVEVCRFPDDTFSEISGMTYSQRHSGVLWIHNDSGGGSLLYAVDAVTCATLATVTVAGIEARDLEAIGSGRDANGRPVLWVGDIGDNRDSWPEIRLHRIREPRVLEDRVVAARTFRVVYQDRPHDAEALLADPASTRVWIVTKQLARGRLYALPERMSAGDVNVATPVRQEGGLVTDGAVSPDGSRYVLRDYVDAEVFTGLPPGDEPALVYLPIQLQGEAVTWTEDGRALLVASEGDRRLLRVALPEHDTAPAPDPAAPDSSRAPDSAGTAISSGEPSSSAPAAQAPTPSVAPVVAVLLVVAAGAVIGAVELRRRRPPAG